MRATPHRRVFHRSWTIAVCWTLAAACGDSTSPVPVATVEVTPATAERLVGESVQLTAVAKDASGATLGGRKFTWTTSSSSVATVNASGLVTGVSDGTATITATSEGKSASATIAVTDRCSTTRSVAISVGQTMNGTLAPGDCQLTDQSYADGYFITVNAVTNIQIDLVSSAFDAFLFLFEETATDLVELATDDDTGGGNNARIVHALSPGKTYHIVANSFNGNETGAYTLSVSQAAVMGAATAGRPSSASAKRPGVKFVPARGGPKQIR